MPAQPAPAPVPSMPAPAPLPLRSRRAVLAAALGSLAGSLATVLGRPAETSAAAGDPLILGQQNHAGSSATRLNTTSSGGALWLTQNGSGSGVRGESWNGTGGVFVTHHPDRQGLLAQHLGAAGTGAALRVDGGQNLGLYASSDSNARAAVWAVSSGFGTGVYGASASHYGVHGYSTNDIGVYGDSDGDIGVVGFSPNHVGVVGQSGADVGIYGLSINGYGVYGISNGTHAGYFDGTCYASSFVTPASPTVRLDHPLAPAREVLAHATVISDEATTVYAGTVTTDAQGEATVRLPAWFEALNTDLRYQLTVVGRDARAWVKSKVKAGRFSVATSEPDTEVCWQLTGVRADAYARAHPLVVESAKTGREKGRYLTPTEHGQPASRGVDYELRQTPRALNRPALD